MKRKNHTQGTSRFRRRMPLIGRRDERMAGGRRFISMRVKFLAVLAVTGVMVLVAALVLIPLTLQVFRNYYMKTEHVEERLESHITRFAAFVEDEHIRSDDAASVVRWTRLHRSVYLTVFNDENHQFGAAGGELWQDGTAPDMKPFFDPIISSGSSLEVTPDESGKVYLVRFADGVHSVALVDYSLSTFTDFIIVGGVLLAICVFFIVTLVYYHLQTRAIVHLSREVEAVSEGHLEADIAADRNDEIGQLAEDVNRMRSTILEKMAEREQAWQANSDLLTSMTHDIRTPLTALLGYMELLDNEKESMTEQQKTYLRICTQKAEQIKGLSDQLFLYFWAYNHALSPSELKLERFGAALLFEQLIGDNIPRLQAKGLQIEADLSGIRDGDEISVDVENLRRVTDNVFDNILKYAAPSSPIRIKAERGDGCLHVCFENKAEREDVPTGTHIGVKTCVSIMKSLQGGFETHAKDETFSAILTLPIEP